MIQLTELIYRKENLVSKEHCKYFIDIFEKHVNKSFPEGSAKYFPNQPLTHVEDNFLALNLSREYHNDLEIKEAAELAFYYIKTMVINYTQYLKIKITPAINSYCMEATDHIRIMRYQEGQEIKDHLDAGTSNNRASCTLNLNSDYEGGEFSFFSGKHLLNLKEGEGMIFPAEQIWVHGVRPVTKNTRYSINCFLYPDFRKANL